MKFDTSGLESTASVFGTAGSQLVDGFSAAPAFELPTTTDVSFSFVCYALRFVWEGGSQNCLWVEFDFAFWFQFDGFQKEAVQMVKPAKGTTTLAFIFKDGVIVAADSRASMGGYICMFIYLFIFFGCWISFWFIVSLRGICVGGYVCMFI